MRVKKKKRYHQIRPSFNQERARPSRKGKRSPPKKIPPTGRKGEKSSPKLYLLNSKSKKKKTESLMDKNHGPKKKHFFFRRESKGELSQLPESFATVGKKSRTPP